MKGGIMEAFDFFILLFIGAILCTTNNVCCVIIGMLKNSLRRKK
jgi:hypothetical protein